MYLSIGFGHYWFHVTHSLITMTSHHKLRQVKSMVITRSTFGNGYHNIIYTRENPKHLRKLLRTRQCKATNPALDFGLAIFLIAYVKKRLHFLWQKSKTRCPTEIILELASGQNLSLLSWIHIAPVMWVTTGSPGIPDCYYTSQCVATDATTNGNERPCCPCCFYCVLFCMRDNGRMDER